MPLFAYLKGGEFVDEVEGLDGEGDEALDEVGDVAGVIRGPEVGVVDDAALVVLALLITVDGPVDGAAAIHLVAIGHFGDVAQGQRAVHDEGGAVFAALPAELHLLHPRVGEVALLL